MKLKDIMIETLKLLNISDDVNEQDLDVTLNDSYKQYITRMRGSINRCFSDIELKQVLPLSKEVLTNGTPINGGVKFELPNGIVDRITSTGERYNSFIPYLREGNTVIIENVDKDATYTLLYRAKIPRLGPTTSIETEIDLPDNISCLIPYFVKGDIFREEPNEAAESMNWYEQEMALIFEDYGFQTKVRDVYES